MSVERKKRRFESTEKLRQSLKEINFETEEKDVREVTEVVDFR